MTLLQRAAVLHERASPFVVRRAINHMMVAEKGRRHGAQDGDEFAGWARMAP